MYSLFLFLTFYSWFFLLWILISINFIRILSYFYFLLVLILILLFFSFFNKSILWYQLVLKFYKIDLLNISYTYCIDSISIFLVLISAFILCLCFLSYWFLRYKISLYSFMLLFSLWVLNNVFTVSDFFLFYFFFESIVIPMFFLIVFEVVVHVKFTHLINFFYILYLVLFLYYYVYIYLFK